MNQDCLEDRKHLINEKQMQIVNRVAERLNKIFNVDFTKISLQKFDLIRTQIWQLIDEEIKHSNLGKSFDSAAKAETFQMMIQSKFGYGVLDSLINDPDITEIRVNGMDEILIEKMGMTFRAEDDYGVPLRFDCVDDLVLIIEKLISPAGKKLLTIVDHNVKALLPNGFLVYFVLKPCSILDNILTIRKPSKIQYTVDHLVRLGMLPDHAAIFLQKAVEAKRNIVICGKAGSGKTTFLNAMSCYIPSNSKIVTIEEIEELKLFDAENLIRLGIRTSTNSKIVGIPPQNIIRAAATIRPDQILADGLQSRESYALIREMDAGQAGVLFTGQAETSSEMFLRLEAMAYMTDDRLPLMFVRRQISNAVNLIVCLGRLQNGLRRVLQITEVLGTNANDYITKEIYRLEGDS